MAPAQKPPNCGANLCGDDANRSRWAALVKRHRASRQTDSYRLSPLAGWPSRKYATGSYPLIATFSASVLTRVASSASAGSVSVKIAINASTMLRSIDEGGVDMG